MKADEAFRLLESDHPHDRLRGARMLARLAEASHGAQIHKLLSRETVPWVRNAMEQALERAEGRVARNLPAGNERPEPDTGVVEDIYLRAHEEVVSTLLHEIHPKVGYIRNAAMREIPRFDESDTKKRIEYLEDLLALLAVYRKASQRPQLEEFELAELLDSAVAELKAEKTVRSAGPRPHIVVGDKSRIRLAVTNGLRNAIEAAGVGAEGASKGVALTWGSDNSGHWISIVDQGPGLRGNVEGMFEIGRTTKPDHFGMGLPIAKQAMYSMGGTVSLSPGDQGGARFEINWERQSS